jgi:hypothetical protein
MKYEDNLGLLTWTGGTGKYLVTIEGKGIVCETLLGVKTCKFGPLESNKTYTGTILAQNTPLSNSRTANISFTTGNLTTALDQYALDQAAAAKVIKEKADLVKAEEFLASLSKQIELARQVEVDAENNFTDNLGASAVFFATLDAADANVAKTTTEIKKMIAAIQSVVVRIIKKIGT